LKVILTHENADFDALAAQLAASMLYSGAIPLLSRRLNSDVMAFLQLYREQLPFRSVEQLARRHVTDAIIVDAQSVPSVRGMDATTSYTIVDHHPLRGERRNGVGYLVEEVGATTTLLVEQLRERRMALTPVEATLMLMGIYEDTGSLMYTSTTSRDLRSAAWLLESGASLSVANDFLRRPLDERYQEVYGQLVDNVEWHNRHGQAVLVAVAHLDEYLEELSTLAHKVDDVFDPDASFLLFVFKDQMQLIARSSSKAVDVGEIARVFGGGGHEAAAAAMIMGSDWEGVKKRLVDELKHRIKPPVTVRQIMSYGVHSLSPEMTVAEADGYVRRYGHEGFPVVENGQLVGVLTRREIDRAMQHGLGSSSVRNYMHKGNVAVSPSDGVNRVQQIMTDHGVGQVPVVEDGKVLGIVTRTDLIKLWTSHAQPDRRGEIQEKLRKALPVPLLNLLWQARDVANKMGHSLYVVGGFVRDLMLGVPNLDLDLVVEGDAVSVARELAKQLKGRVRSHSRFGTATILLEGTKGTSLPASLDFVTARTEFYQHPTALPEVERSSIKQDLYRRDFTINTMAICLDGDRYGDLLDFYGGERDLRDGLVRVLHIFSFVEDPTRIMRAVRLEQRLGFRLETRTAELVADALELLNRVSGERLRHELELILDERAPAVAVRRLGELGVLRGLEPGLEYDNWLAGKLESSVAWHQNQVTAVRPGSEASVVHLEQNKLLLALLTYRLDKMQLTRFLDRLRFGLEVRKFLREVHQLRSLANRLEKPELKPSRVYRLLDGYSADAATAFWLALDSEVARQHVRLYLDRLRWVRTLVGGEYLKGLGLRPGPLYGRVLDRLLFARLDGRIHTLHDEQSLARRLVARLAESDAAEEGQD